MLSVQVFLIEYNFCKSLIFQNDEMFIAFYCLRLTESKSGSSKENKVSRVNFKEVNFIQINSHINKTIVSFLHHSFTFIQKACLSHTHAHKHTQQGNQEITSAIGNNQKWETFRSASKVVVCPMVTCHITGHSNPLDSSSSETKRFFKWAIF